jgi:hypothetical protein
MVTKEHVIIAKVAVAVAACLTILLIVIAVIMLTTSSDVTRTAKLHTTGTV